MVSLLIEKRRLKQHHMYRRTILKQTPEGLLSSICNYYMLSREDVKGRSRAASLMKARAAFCYIGIEMGLSTTEAGQALNRDHALAIYHHRKYKNYLDKKQPWFDADLSEEIEDIRSQLITCK